MSGTLVHLFVWTLAWLCYTLVPFEPRAVLCPTETGCGGTEPEAHHQVLEGFSLIKPMVGGAVGRTKDSKPTATCVKRGHWWMNVFASAVRLNRLCFGRLVRICLGLRLMQANADESIHVCFIGLDNSRSLRVISSLLAGYKKEKRVRYAYYNELRDLSSVSRTVAAPLEVNDSLIAQDIGSSRFSSSRKVLYALATISQ
jgi:hypothetical protein